MKTKNKKPDIVYLFLTLKFVGRSRTISFRKLKRVLTRNLGSSLKPLTLKMTSAQIVETSVTKNSSFQNYSHPVDHILWEFSNQTLVPSNMSNLQIKLPTLVSFHLRFQWSFGWFKVILLHFYEWMQKQWTSIAKDQISLTWFLLTLIALWVLIYAY